MANAFGVFVFVRDEFLPIEWQEQLRLVDVIERLSWYVWVIIGLVLFMFVFLWTMTGRIIELQIENARLTSELEKENPTLELSIDCSPPTRAAAWVTLRIGNHSQHSITGCIGNLMKATKLEDSRLC